MLSGTNLMLSQPGGVTTLTWDPEASVGSYNVYRGTLSELPTTYGTNIEPGWTGETYPDTDPYGGESWFYLITASNRIAEEGTKGTDSSGTERP